MTLPAGPRLRARARASATSKGRARAPCGAPGARSVPREIGGRLLPWPREEDPDGWKGGWKGVRPGARAQARSEMRSPAAGRGAVRACSPRLFPRGARSRARPIGPRGPFRPPPSPVCLYVCVIAAGRRGGGAVSGLGEWGRGPAAGTWESEEAGTSWCGLCGGRHFRMLASIEHLIKPRLSIQYCVYEEGTSCRSTPRWGEVGGHSGHAGRARASPSSSLCPPSAGWGKGVAGGRRRRQARPVAL